MESHQSCQTVSQPLEISSLGPVIVQLPSIQPKQEALEVPSKSHAKEPDASTRDSVQPATPPTSLPYADIARRAIASPGPLFIPKRRAPQSRPLEDPVAYPTLDESRIRAASEPKRASHRPKGWQPSPPSVKQEKQADCWPKVLEPSDKTVKDLVDSQKPTESPVLNQLCEIKHDRQSCFVQAPAERLTEYALSEQCSNHLTTVAQIMTEPSSEKSMAEQRNEKSFIAQLKATFNIQETGFSEVQACSSGGVNIAELKSHAEKRTSSILNPLPNAESARQLECHVQVFFPKPKAAALSDSASSLSTNNSFWDVSRSSPCSPLYQRTTYRHSSVPPTPIRDMAAGLTENPGNLPESSHCNSRLASSDTIIGSGAVSSAEVQGIIMGGPALSPTRQGTYATQRIPEVIEHRGVPSMHGVIGLAAPGSIPVTGGFEQGPLSASWHRISAPYSPSIYDAGSTPLRPDFGMMYHPPEVTTSRLAHVTVPCETLERLFGQTERFSNELGLVRTELQAQTLQLQQLTAHVNILCGQNGATVAQNSVPTPTAAFRTPPSAGTTKYNYDCDNSGSPMERGPPHQRQMSDATVRQDNIRPAVPAGPAFIHGKVSAFIQPAVPHTSAFENQASYVPAPISKTAHEEKLGTIVDQSKAHSVRRNPSRPIVFGQMHQDVPRMVQHDPAITIRQHEQQPSMKSPGSQAQPMIVNSVAHHRKTNSVRSQHGSEQFNRFTPPFNSGQGHEYPANNLFFQDGLGSKSQTKVDGTWGGTRNWYHQAYGNEKTQN